MKPTLRILLLALLALATTLILSCGPPPVSINDRINMFVSSLNGNRTDTYTNCDPNATDYNAAKAPSFWNGLFSFPNPYGASNINTSNAAAVTALISYTGGSGTYTFAMVNSPVMGSDNWLISTISVTGPGVIFQ